MWIPDSAEELERVVPRGEVEESSSLDFKREISAKSKDLAKDAAAMANDGGVLIFGVGEDEHGRPVIPTPFPLADQAERISTIIRSSISEPPEVTIRTLPLDRDPTSGFIVVIIPSSPRAPHMVTVGGENRYYGRTAKGNAILTEGEVARLYERRKLWDVDREALLSEAVASAPLGPSDQFGYLFLLAKPIATRDDLVSIAGADTDSYSLIRRAIDAASQSEVFPRVFSPSFSSGWITPISTGWLVYMGGRPEGDSRVHGSTLDLRIGFDGRGSLFCGRAAETFDGVLRLFDRGVAETTTRFLVTIGTMLREAGYIGPCDLGVALTGVRGAISQTLVSVGHFASHFSRFDADSYRCTTRVLADNLVEEPRAVARKLLSRLFHATTGGQIDPLE